MQIRTDLAMESQALSQSPEGVTSRVFRRGMLEETYVKVETEEAAKALDKDRGTYITLYHPTLSHAGAGERKEIAQSLAKVIRRLTPAFGDILVVGLGNRYMTADSLGSRVLEDLLSEVRCLSSTLEQARFYKERVLSAMSELRLVVDEMESHCAASCWPYPSYGDILFSVK